MKQTLFKIAIVGDGACGKTSLIRAKTGKKFIEGSKITIGVDFACIPFEMGEKQIKPTSFLAMDLGGQPRFHFMHDSYIKGIKAAVILYDLSRYRSFMNLPKWFDLLNSENAEIPLFLVGTKLDLVNESKLQFYREEWEKMRASIPNSYNVVSHTFISSKTFEGIPELFYNCESTMRSREVDSPA